MKNKFRIVLYSALVLTACNKADDSSKVIDKSNATELLTANAWKNYKVQIGKNNGPLIEYPITACQVDDLKWFETDGDIVRDRGEERCAGESERKKKEGTWKWNEDKTIITTEAGEGVGVIKNKVEKLDANIMILSSVIIDADGTRYENLIEFRR